MITEIQKPTRRRRRRYKFLPLTGIDQCLELNFQRTYSNINYSLITLQAKPYTGNIQQNGASTVKIVLNYVGR
jgi:hypothetical protein